MAAWILFTDTRTPVPMRTVGSMPPRIWSPVRAPLAYARSVPYKVAIVLGPSAGAFGLAALTMVDGVYSGAGMDRGDSACNEAHVNTAQKSPQPNRTVRLWAGYADYSQRACTGIVVPVGELTP